MSPAVRPQNKAPRFGAASPIVWKNSTPISIPPMEPLRDDRYSDRITFEQNDMLASQSEHILQCSQVDEYPAPIVQPVRRLTITCDARGSLVTTDPKLSPDQEIALANAIINHSKRAMHKRKDYSKDRRPADESAGSSTKRKRSSAHRPASPDTSGSRSSSTYDHADCSDSSESSNADQSSKFESFADVTAPDQVTHLLESLFLTVNQHACRTLAKALIKCIEPDKQAEHPYRREQRAAARARDSLSGRFDLPVRTPEWSVWWPDTVTYRGETIPMDFVEPDHLNKERRVGLLIYMLRLPANCPAYWKEICAKDELFTGTKDCVNWATWLASKTSQLDLYDKNSRRTKHREFNRQAAHSVQEAMGARRNLLDIVFKIINCEEMQRRGDLNSQPILRFHVPSIFLESFLKLETGNTYHPTDELDGKNSQSVLNKRPTKKRLFTPPESGDEAPRCSTSRPCRMRDRLSNEVINMTIQEQTQENQAFLHSSFTTQSDDDNVNKNGMQQLRRLSNAEVPHVSGFLPHEHVLQSHESIATSNMSLGSDSIMAPQFQYFSHIDDQSSSIHWDQRPVNFYTEHHFSPPWSPLASGPPIQMVSTDDSNSYHNLHNMSLYSPDGLWANNGVPPLSTQIH